MIKNYLKITFRSLSKSKLFVLINILGMGIAIACGIVAYLNYDYNVNFDKNQSDVLDVYRINSERVYQNRKQAYGMTPMPIGMAVKENLGEVDAVMRYMPTGGQFKIGDELFNENFTFVDANFLDFFNFNIVKGKSDGLQSKKNILISTDIVEKYFSDGEALGKTMTQFTDDGPRDYVVAGIFEKQVLNSSFGNTQIITNISNWFDINKTEDKDPENDWSYWITTFVKIKDKSRLRAVEERLTNDYIEIQNKARLDFKLDKYMLDNFQGMAHRAADELVWGHWLNESMPPPAVFIPVVMSVLIVLIACFNFTNTSMAIASKRLKEIGLRKVMGGLRQQLIVQFLLENMVLCFFSLLTGLLIALFLVPAYSEMWPFLEIDMSFNKNVNFYFFLILFLIVIGLIAGSYPAFYVSKFEPASILKGSSKVGGTGIVTNVLLVLQFSISLLAIVLGVIFYQNAVFQEEMDYGYDLTGTISVNLEDEDEFKAFSSHINGNADIISLAGSEHQINRSYRNDPVINAGEEYDIDIIHIGANYFETLDYELIEGRKFREDSETDMKESVIVSEEMVRVFGWEEPLGQKLVWMDTVPLYVVGVMKNAFINGLWDPLTPLMFRYVPEEDYRFLTIKTSRESIKEVNEYLEGQWKEMFPDKMYTGGYMDDQLTNASMVNTNILKMFTFLGVVATFMSILGLFSIVSLSVLKRMKEVGVRKVLGASIPNLMFILNKNFIVILLIASVLGIAASYFLSGAMMGLIWKYHVDPGVMSFLSSVILLLILALTTISFKVYRAAMTNPTETIRAE